MTNKGQSIKNQVAQLGGEFIENTWSFLKAVGLTALTPGNVPTAAAVTELVKAEQNNLYGNADKVRRSLESQGLKTEQYSREEKEKINREFNTSIINHQREVNDLLGKYAASGGSVNMKPLDLTPQRYEELYRKGVENTRDQPIRGFNQGLIYDKDVEKAIENNNIAVLANRGDMVLYGNKGSDRYVGKEVIDKLQGAKSYRIDASNQVLTGVPRQYVGGYKVSVMADGEVYDLLVPPTTDEVTNLFTPAGNYNEAKMKPANGKGFVTEPMIPIPGPNGIQYFPAIKTDFPDPETGQLKNLYQAVYRNANGEYVPLPAKTVKREDGSEYTEHYIFDDTEIEERLKETIQEQGQYLNKIYGTGS